MMLRKLNKMRYRFWCLKVQGSLIARVSLRNSS